MKKFLVGMLILGSMSSYASEECESGNYRLVISKENISLTNGGIPEIMPVNKSQRIKRRSDTFFKILNDLQDPSKSLDPLSPRHANTVRVIKTKEVKGDKNSIKIKFIKLLNKHRTLAGRYFVLDDGFNKSIHRCNVKILGI